MSEKFLTSHNTKTFLTIRTVYQRKAKKCPKSQTRKLSYFKKKKKF